MTIIEFLLARIAEDEREAKEAQSQSAQWWVDGPAEQSGEWWVYATGAKFAERSVADHIARHDPARILRECAAKRAIVDLHRSEKWNIPPTPDPDGAEYVHTHDGIVMSFGGSSRLITFEEYASRIGATLLPPDPELLHLAAVYADHPDYKHEWGI